MTSFFSAEGGPIWIKFRRLVQNDMSTAVHVVEIEIRCRIRIWWTFGRIQWHVIPERRITCRVLPLGKFTVMIPEPHATLQGAVTLAKSMSWSCHIAGCKNSICHIENRFSTYFVFNAV